MVKAMGCLIGIGNGGFGFWVSSDKPRILLCYYCILFYENAANLYFFLLQGAYNGELVWDFGEVGMYSRVLDGIYRQKVWWWQRRGDRARNVIS
ncbi:hypothetical protein E1A91_A06G113700v1 [Gossypium mustelinum]|uniref:Uncharacterized protein n=1 Tax=Gossypium mustelinum TaxID=34275 RepID=A0A5D2YVV1_GOSMU|nr:hypothetical protein E1A91_A06G113700v1 [Gossypium mustelinum]